MGKVRLNRIGLSKNDYKGQPSTLCKGCGHNSIVNQMVQIAYDLDIEPHKILRMSGIGCSSKSPAYFWGQSSGFNTLHGRMPSVSTGALMANHQLTAVGISGDGDTSSIGMGQFKHLLRRNVRMVYIVENNGVYGLTKGQFSATADEGQTLKHGEFNPFPPVDIAMEAIISGCGFVARSFSGDAKQVRELVKAALSHRGTAVIDIISPCVAFNNMDSSTKSYSYGRDHQFPLHDIGWVPAADEIMIDEYAPGEMQTVELHDGSYLQLRKLEADYNPRDRMAAIQRLQMADLNEELVTGLIYYDDKRPSLAEVANMNDTPLAHLTDAQIRPSAGSLDGLMATMR